MEHVEDSAWTEAVERLNSLMDAGSFVCEDDQSLFNNVFIDHAFNVLVGIYKVISATFSAADYSDTKLNEVLFSICKMYADAYTAASLPESQHVGEIYNTYIDALYGIVKEKMKVSHQFMFQQTNPSGEGHSAPGSFVQVVNRRTSRAIVKIAKKTKIVLTVDNLNEPIPGLVAGDGQPITGQDIIDFITNCVGKMKRNMLFKTEICRFGPKCKREACDCGYLHDKELVIMKYLMSKGCPLEGAGTFIKMLNLPVGGYRNPEANYHFDIDDPLENYMFQCVREIINADRRAAAATKRNVFSWADEVAAAEEDEDADEEEEDEEDFPRLQ